MPTWLDLQSVAGGGQTALESRLQPVLGRHCPKQRPSGQKRNRRRSRRDALHLRRFVSRTPGHPPWRLRRPSRGTEPIPYSAGANDLHKPQAPALFSAPPVTRLDGGRGSHAPRLYASAAARRGCGDSFLPPRTLLTAPPRWGATGSALLGPGPLSPDPHGARPHHGGAMTLTWHGSALADEVVPLGNPHSRGRSAVAACSTRLGLCVFERARRAPGARGRSATCSRDEVTGGVTSSPRMPRTASRRVMPV
jgi:hypothetical protein